MRVHELPDALRKYGVEPVEVSGWQTRGKEFPARPDGALRHWTAGGSAPTSSLNVVTHGRSDLPGPLCHVLQSREPSGRDKAYVVASGIANHAGRGNWNGITGNSRLLGLEIEWKGPNEHFPPERVDVSERIMRALLDCCAGTNTDDVAEHREYALPKGRKIDTNLSGDVLRRRMVELAAQPLPQPEPHPEPPQEDDVSKPRLVMVHPDRVNELPERMRDAASNGAWLYLCDGYFWWCPTVGHADEMHRLGLAQNNRPDVISPSFLKEHRPRCSADLDPSSLIEGPPGTRASFFSVDGRVHHAALDVTDVSVGKVV